MKRLFRQFLPAVLCVLLVQPALATEQILRFHSDIEVLADSTMRVTEMIRVVAEGQQIRRGIYRDFPTDYRDRLGNRIRVGFEVLTVTRNGLNETFFTEPYSNGVRVYVGSANRLLEPGEYEYALTYRTSRQLGYFENHDELYWNVTGNGWGFPINEASARVRLPNGVLKDDMAVEGYTGPSGAAGQDYTAGIDGDGEAWIRTTRGLRPQEGLTLVVSWPKGAVHEPAALERMRNLLTDNRGLLIALTGLLLLAAYLYYAWFHYGRDPEPGAVFPHYEPPQELSPGACRYIREMGHDNEAFTAAVLNLAVKGYLRIHEGRTEALETATGESPFENALDKLSPFQKKMLGSLFEMAEDALQMAYDNSFVLERLKEEPGLPELGPGESALLAKLFDAGDYLLLSNDNHEIVAAAISAHSEALRKYYQQRHFATNGRMVLPAVLIAAVATGAAILSGQQTPATFLVLVPELLLILWFTRLMKAPTLRGRSVMDQLDGFHMYLSVAEAEDLQRVENIAGASPKQTPELFERLLPYAVAMGVAQPWADQFERLFTRLSAEQGRSYRPHWYNSTKPVNRVGRFTSSMTSSLKSAISSSSTPPGSSSGSGGGGSSGGGGGGGGGGGW